LPTVGEWRSALINPADGAVLASSPGTTGLG
jgi:hypothetical protein